MIRVRFIQINERGIGSMIIKAYLKIKMTIKEATKKIVRHTIITLYVFLVRVKMIKI